MDSRRWTRRAFGQAALALAGSSLAVQSGLSTTAASKRLAFVGSAPPDQPERGSIHSFRVVGDRWTALATLPAPAPAHLLMHPTLPVLYAVHAVDTWDHLPRGAVSAYSVDRQTGRLGLLHTQPLSLSATYPCHAVLTAGASHLFVAAVGGGIFNLLPVTTGGALLPVSAIRKEFGSEENSTAKLSTPDSTALLPDGTLLAADSGQETLTSFAIEQDALVVRHRTRVHPGEGPARLSVSPDGRFAYTFGATSGAVQRHRLVDGRAVQTAALAPPMVDVPREPKAHVQHAISLLLV